MSRESTKLRIAAAMLELGQFTTRQLARQASVNPNTAKTAVQRDYREQLDELGAIDTGKPGRPPTVWRVRPSLAASLERMLRDQAEPTFGPILDLTRRIASLKAQLADLQQADPGEPRFDDELSLARESLELLHTHQRRLPLTDVSTLLGPHFQDVERRLHELEHLQLRTQAARAAQSAAVVCISRTGRSALPTWIEGARPGDQAPARRMSTVLFVTCRPPWTWGMGWRRTFWGVASSLPSTGKSTSATASETTARLCTNSMPPPT